MFFLAAISRTMIESLYSDNTHIIKELEEKAKKRVYKNIKNLICSNCRYSNSTKRYDQNTYSSSIS